jgi:hypothetical protein
MAGEETGGPLEAAEEVADEIFEEIFPPKPGGLIDRHRKRRDAEQARAEEQRNAQEKIEEPAYRAVKVAPESPENFSTPVYTIPAGGVAMVLPLSMHRYRATIIATGAAGAGPVILAKDQSSALGGIGYPIPLNTPMVVFARAQLWASNAAGTAPATVSALAESYAPESR